MRFLLLLATVAAVWAATANAAAVAEKAEKDKNDRSVGEKEEKATCETECQKVFGDDKKGVLVDDELKSCKTGCTLLTIIDAIDNPETELNETLENCKKSCAASYEKEGETDSCVKGCEFQMPYEEDRRKETRVIRPVSAVPMMFGFPSVEVGFPSLSGLSSRLPSLPELPEMPAGLPDMFGRLHSQMSSMMSRMMSQAEQLQRGEIPEGAGSGRLTVIKSGPGFHEEKTYNFGPEGVQSQSHSQRMPVDGANQKLEDQTNMLNDMMSKVNPLDLFFGSNLQDVEMIDPKETEITTKKEKEEEEEEEDSAFVRGFDFEGPRLPEEGLKTRQYTFEEPPRRISMRDQICAERSEHMKWSDWVSCLHLRMGLPRWLTAATVSLGVVFVIWLCLVIPQNAPKQRVKMTKAMEAAAVTKLAGDLPMGFEKKDMPPAYDDIAHLHVAVPVENDNHTEKKERA